MLVIECNAAGAEAGKVAMATNHNKLDRFSSLIIVIICRTSAATCYHVADKTVGCREKVDGTVSIGDECRLHSKRLQHLHLSINIHSQLP